MSSSDFPSRAGNGTVVDGRRVIARVGRRFIPFAFVCYVVAYLDRVNVHFKDIALVENETGFLMSEVPLGEGILDLKRMVKAIRTARPDVYFSLEMITRDPLDIPCLTDKYWASFPEVNGVALARMLSRIRANRPSRPLPSIAGMTSQERFVYETQLVTRSIDYAVRELGL